MCVPLAVLSCSFYEFSVDFLARDCFFILKHRFLRSSGKWLLKINSFVTSPLPLLIFICTAWAGLIRCQSCGFGSEFTSFCYARLSVPYASLWLFQSLVWKFLERWMWKFLQYFCPFRFWKLICQLLDVIWIYVQASKEQAGVLLLQPENHPKSQNKHHRSREFC